MNAISNVILALLGALTYVFCKFTVFSAEEVILV